MTAHPIRVRYRLSIAPDVLDIAFNLELSRIGNPEVELESTAQTALDSVIESLGDALETAFSTNDVRITRQVFAFDEGEQIYPPAS